MYTKDKSNRITLRLNDKQFDFVKANADILGVSPSDFLRMVINSSMATVKAVADKRNPFDVLTEGSGRENDEANFNDKL